MYSPCFAFSLFFKFLISLYNLIYLLDYVNKNLIFLLFFLDFSPKKGDIKLMEGLTISEMATELGIAPNAVLQRLFVAGIKPITKEAIYDKSALETIRSVPGKGRPRKAPK
jgi:hypothetical protein